MAPSIEAWEALETGPVVELPETECEATEKAVSIEAAVTHSLMSHYLMIPHP